MTRTKIGKYFGLALRPRGRDALLGAGAEKVPLALANTKEREFIEHRLKIPVSKVTDFDAFLKVGSKNVWAAFRACHIVANRVLSTKFSVGERDSELRGGGPVADRGGEVTRFLESPNPFDSWEDMAYLWVFHMKLTGNAYWLKDEIDGRGAPANLFPLLPQHVKPVPGRFEKIDHYVYQVGARQVRIEVEEMIHFRRPHPMNLLLGMGDVEPSQGLYSDYINRDTYREKFFENGASPSGILIKEEAEEDEDEWEKLKKWWDKSYSGQKNIGKTAMMNGKWTYTQLGLSDKDMQTLEREELSVRQIFLNMGIPLSVAGFEGAANYATSRQDEIHFKNNEVVPLINMLVGKLNAEGEFVDRFNPRWKIVYEIGGLIDLEQVGKDYGGLVDRGAMTLNELREKAGLGRVDDPLLDQYLVDRNRVPIEFAGLAALPAPTGEPGQ